MNFFLPMPHLWMIPGSQQATLLHPALVSMEQDISSVLTWDRVTSCVQPASSALLGLGPAKCGVRPADCFQLGAKSNKNILNQVLISTLPRSGPRLPYCPPRRQGGVLSFSKRITHQFLAQRSPWYPLVQSIAFCRRCAGAGNRCL